MKKHILSIALCATFTSATAVADVLPTKPFIPKDNPMTAEKIQLGKQLFFDPRLSATGTVSCNSCHNVMSGGDDDRATSMGVHGKTGDRNSPTVWNSAFHSVQFWDGRAATLEDQAKGPLTNPIEMGMESHDLVMARIQKIPAYVQQFKKVFGDKNPMTIDNAAKAIAAYERTLIAGNSPYDRFKKGDKRAMSAQAQRGLKTAQEVGCFACHSGPMFSGPIQMSGQGFYMKFPQIPGSEYDKKYKLDKDLGRYQVTKNDADKNMWRVASWRNVALTAPYFHNGSVKTLDEAVRVMAMTQLHRELTDEQVKDIVAFLNSLTGEFPKQDMPRLPELPGATALN